jgi:hypothetical protein
VQTTDAEAARSDMTEEELLSVKAEYLAAHSTYQTYVALCATAELENSQSWNELRGELEQARKNLDRARSAYRNALFGIAFGTAPGVRSD